MVTFNSQQVIKKLLNALPTRSQDIIVQRYGLGAEPRKQTLENIGRQYNITRERVRQIENHSIKSICKSGVFGETAPVFDELQTSIKSMGGVVTEKELANALANQTLNQNNLHFLLVLGDPFIKECGDLEFETRWSIDSELSKNIILVLKNIHKNFTEDILMDENKLIALFNQRLNKTRQDIESNDEIIRKWLTLSKVIGKNPFGEWGRATSQNIKIRGIRSYAYLVVRRNGSPMHFAEVAKMIQEYFNKKAHIATCHNELIKDPRFVLVGRGLYALSEWGYNQGIVRDVIKNILEREGPLTAEQIVEKVLKERYVKENTVKVNLQNSDLFQKTSAGLYALC